MKNDMQKQLESLNKNVLEATRELIDMNGRYMNKVLNSQIELANLYVEGGERQLEATKDVNDPKEFVSRQSAILEEYAGKLAEATEKNIKLAQEAGVELQAWVKKNVKPVDFSK